MFYMIEEMSFKCLLDVPLWIVLPRDVFRNPIKTEAYFAKIVNNFQPLTISVKKLHHRYLSEF